MKILIDERKLRQGRNGRRRHRRGSRDIGTVFEALETVEWIELGNTVQHHARECPSAPSSPDERETFAINLNIRVDGDYVGTAEDELWKVQLVGRLISSGAKLTDTVEQAYAEDCGKKRGGGAA